MVKVNKHETLISYALAVKKSKDINSKVKAIENQMEILSKFDGIISEIIIDKTGNKDMILRSEAIII